MDLLRCKYKTHAIVLVLTIFNEGAYFTFRSIFSNILFKKVSVYKM